MVVNFQSVDVFWVNSEIGNLNDAPLSEEDNRAMKKATEKLPVSIIKKFSKLYT